MMIAMVFFNICVFAVFVGLEYFFQFHQRIFLEKLQQITPWIYSYIMYSMAWLFFLSLAYYLIKWLLDEDILLLDRLRVWLSLGLPLLFWGALGLLGSGGPSNGPVNIPLYMLPAMPGMWVSDVVEQYASRKFPHERPDVCKLGIGEILADDELGTRAISAVLLPDGSVFAVIDVSSRPDAIPREGVKLVRFSSEGSFDGSFLRGECYEGFKKKLAVDSNGRAYLMNEYHQEAALLDGSGAVVEMEMALPKGSVVGQFSGIVPAGEGGLFHAYNPPRIRFEPDPRQGVFQFGGKPSDYKLLAEASVWKELSLWDIRAFRVLGNGDVWLMGFFDENTQERGDFLSGTARVNANGKLAERNMQKGQGLKSSLLREISFNYDVDRHGNSSAGGSDHDPQFEFDENGNVLAIAGTSDGGKSNRLVRVGKNGDFDEAFSLSADGAIDFDIETYGVAEDGRIIVAGSDGKKGFPTARISILDSSGALEKNIL